jgi:hypothetical protein
MGDRLDRVRQIIEEIGTLPATEASLEKALALVTEAILLLAEESQELRNTFTGAAVAPPEQKPQEEPPAPAKPKKAKRSHG